ncbi:MAG TPA: AEC family transporter [Weissella thailandensis]|uniref:AEC family transporter n=1 Tax=Weissella thailandensis TaxID=89061 RepID=UPI001DF87C42|nr:AEC family transporter [Weissella thailandensis]HJG84472.1 AEC family transporter [Weissella thailandensis]
MTALTHSITGVLMILGLVAIGFILIKGNVFDDSDGKISRFLSGFISKVALPAYLIVHIPQDFTPKTLLAMGTNILFPLASMVLLLVLSFFIARIIHVDPKHKGLFQSLLFNSNTITVGLPVNMALFGTNSLPYVLIYYMANTTVFWTIGVYMISIDGNHNNKHFNLKNAPILVFGT